MSSDSAYDFVVVGAGPAGATGALAAALLGRRVALIERCPEIGGAGINTGTLPSKTLRETALALSGLKARQLYGVDLSLRREATIQDFMYHERKVTATERSRIMNQLRQVGVTVVHGNARFEDPHTLAVAGGSGGTVRIRGERFLLATGSSPVRPPEFDFNDPRVHDSNEILELPSLPRSLAVVGAGVVGAEYACTFRALGTEVHLVDGRESLLSFLDAEVSVALAAAMESNGIQFHWKERVHACELPSSGPVTLRFESGRSLTVEGLLVAAGRSSNSEDLNLPAAGITPGKRGLIPINEFSRTVVPHIYAAGDVVGPPALASTSAAQARVAVFHALDSQLAAPLSPLLPSGIYTIPEASMLGDTEEILKARGEDYVVGRAPYQRNARGAILGDHSGFLKLLFRRSDLKLLGAHVMGDQATEIIHIALMTMLAGEGAAMLERACFNFPTLGGLYTLATYDAMLRRRGVPSLVE
ncbi:MAG: Si-specific NAD(P)(+) transhydrogenase [Verrucomicrobia bacterium]|nr:Si-specific NAD(P)(+) transhydrogenase [Verrucomicrobiota bacterium]